MKKTFNLTAVFKTTYTYNITFLHGIVLIISIFAEIIKFIIFFFFFNRKKG